MSTVNQINNIPPDKIEEGHTWRDWFFKVAQYLQAEQKQKQLPVYATADAPTPKDGGMYFDSTLNKARVGAGGTWHTITSA